MNPKLDINRLTGELILHYTWRGERKYIVLFRVLW